MPTKNHGINVVKVRHLLKVALETEEDVALSAFAEQRDKTLNNATALDHNEVW
jgi:hypothetical protein